MRIGMILSVPLPPKEGIGFYAWNLARYLTNKGHQVHLITRGAIAPITNEIVDDITIWRPFFIPLYPYHVHIHSFFVNRLLAYLEKDLDILHLHTPLVKLVNSKLPILVTVHSPMAADTRSIRANNLYSWLIKLQAPFSIRLEKELFHGASRLVAVASSVANELKDYGIDPLKVGILANGVDTQIFTFQKKDARKKDPYILTAGRLAPGKGLDDLLDCAEIVIKDFPSIQFLIAGDGPLKENLKREIERRDLKEKVVLLGHISQRQKMVNLFQNTSIYLHPAHHEGLPTVVLEAMACGAPVITTAVSGSLDVIQDRVNGWLVPPHNPIALAQAVKLLLRAPELRDELSVKAVQTVREHYSWDVVGSNYLAEYQHILDR